MYQTESKKGFFVSAIKGAFTSIIFALILILAFAGIIKLTGLNGGVIKPINQFIKAISIFIGCFFSVRGTRGAIKGAIIGILFTIIIHLIFMLIGGDNSLFSGIFLDLIFGLIVGGISGILTVNMKR